MAIVNGTVVSVRIKDLQSFERFATDLLDIRDEARLLWPTTGLAEKIENAITRFYSEDDDAPAF